MKKIVNEKYVIQITTNAKIQEEHTVAIVETRPTTARTSRPATTATVTGGGRAQTAKQVSVT